MKGRRSFWLIGLCALGLSLSTAAIGCGDDDTDGGGTGGGGSGGSSGKAGSTAGKGGSTAGKGGTGGGPSPATCKTATADLMKGQDGLSMECINCICDENAKAVTDCNSNAMCWPLLSCVADKCTDPSMQAACAGTMCGDKLGGAPPAMALGMVIQGAKCASKCVDSGADAGPKDAGL